jgi:hypothetical protein
MAIVSIMSSNKLFSFLPQINPLFDHFYRFMGVSMAGRFLPEWAGSSALLKTTFRTDNGYK